MAETTPEHYARWPFPDAFITVGGKPLYCRLSAHKGSGQWSKKHRGKVYYFGKIDEPERALASWRKRWPLILAGRPDTGNTVMPDASRIAVRQLCREFLAARLADHDAGDLAWRSYLDLRQACALLGRKLGEQTLVGSLQPADFAAVDKAITHLSPAKRRNVIVKVRQVFHWGERNLDLPFPKVGDHLKGASKREIRRHRHERGEQAYTARQIRVMISAASLGQPVLHAFLWLAINAGFNQSDFANLPPGAIDLEKGWIRQPRWKTGFMRRAPLWGETVKAVEQVIQTGGKLAFPSTSGRPWVHGSTDRLGPQVKTLLKTLDLPGSSKWLRNTFITIAAETGDGEASRIIAGHLVESTHHSYVQRFPPARLLKVSDHVHAWLTSSGADPSSDPKALSQGGEDSSARDDEA